MELTRNGKEKDAAPAPTKPPESDVIENIIGGFGKYQLRLCLLIFLCKLPIAFHQMAILFLAPKVAYTCPDTGAQTCPCDNPVYNTTEFKRTIIMEWNLICNRKALASLSQTLFQLGTLIGSILFGMASDRFGRKWPFIAAVVVQVSCGIIAGFIPEYWTFQIFRFLIGMSVGGTMVISFVIIMEFVAAKHRSVVSAVYQIPFNIGHLLLPLIGYFLRDFSHFQLAISVPTAILLIYIIVVPETPRWLITVKQTDKAIDILEKVAKVNNRDTTNIRSQVEAYQISLENSHLKKGTIIDLFRTPNIRKNNLCMAFNWLACSYCFYGVSQYVGQLSGNVFINVACSAFVALLGSLVSIPLLKVMGRKVLVIVFQLLSALVLLILIVVPPGVPAVVCACVGVVASFVTFVVVYLYCTEMFPTVVRNAAVGFSSMMARVGSMIAPFVIDLSYIATWLPPLVFALLPLAAGFVSFLLPETKDVPLMNTIEEAENFEANRKLKKDSSK